MKWREIKIHASFHKRENGMFERTNLGGSRLLLIGVFLFGFLFGSCAPIRVIDCRIFQQSRKNKDKTHHQINVDSFHVADAWQGTPHSGGNCRHGQYSRDACKFRQIQNEKSVHFL